MTLLVLSILGASILAILTIVTSIVQWKEAKASKEIALQKQKELETANQTIMSLQKQTIDSVTTIAKLQDKLIYESSIVKDLQNKLVQKNEETIGSLTGGDSYPHFDLNLRTNLPGDEIAIGFSFAFNINGKYPLKKLKIRLIDIGDFREQSSASYYINLTSLDLDMPSPFPSFGNNNNQLTYKKDFEVIMPEKGYSLPEVNEINPKSNSNSICLNTELQFQGFDLYCQSEYKSWFYRIRFIKIKNKTEYTYTLQNASNWTIIERYKTKGYNYLDKKGEPLYYGK